jgi:SpoIIAA-like
MNYHIKVLRGVDRGNYVIMITRGSVGIFEFEQIIDKVVDATGPLLDCKVLVDFQDSIFKFLPPDITEFVVRFDFKKWPHNNKIAFVSSPEMEQYRHLAMLIEGLLQMKLEVGVFYDMRDAINWLAAIR